MSHVSEIGAEAVLAHGRQSLQALSERPQDAVQPPLFRAKESTIGAFGLDWLMLIVGRAALRKGYDRLGLRASRAAANARPNSLKANVAAGIACRRANRDASALVYLRRAAAHDDSARRGNWELAKLLLRVAREATGLESHAELLAALRQASRSSDPAIRNAASLAWANALYDAGECTEGEQVANGVLSRVPDDPRALRAKANNLVPQNRFAEAAALYQRISAQEPGNGEVARKLQILKQLAEHASPVAPASAPKMGSVRQRLLIGVGSGIGDILHATPMIRNIARRTGAPVEVVVAGDYPQTEFLVANPRYVSRVWPVSRAVLDRSYETVFLTQGFGPLRFDFQAGQIVASSEWRKFRAGILNDTLFNLEAAKHLLGIPYDEADAQHYFVGDLAWRAPAEPWIGLHAGSKSGRWFSKRWPYFAELAMRLSARGFRVASYGTADEYIPGTDNRTGGTIEEMARAMVACSHFVSNDSGPMHIANALGMPVLALYAPTDALSHLPMRSTTTALALKKSCSPCEVKDHRYFASGVCRCIAEISPDVVEANVAEMLAGSPQAASAEAPACVPEGA